MRRRRAIWCRRPVPLPEAHAVATLSERIARAIHAGGPLTFDRFMERALYDPEDGYYTRGGGLGTGGDFITAADHGPWLARCLIRHAADVARRLDPGALFRFIEHGAGRGLLARDVLEQLADVDPPLAGRLRYTAADRSPAMRRAIAAAAPAAAAVEPGAVPAGGQGCLVAVELFDALPARRLRRRGDGTLVEVGVDATAGGRLVETEIALDPALQRLAEARGMARHAGSEAEMHPALETTLAGMLAALDRGVAWIVDYGDEAAALYGPGRARGTLLAYHRHTTHERFLERVGQQDLTAHVDFTALAAAARRLGWEVAGLTTQDRFLIGGGLIDDLDALAPAADASAAGVARRLAGTRLLQPAMGRGFRVLTLSRGVATDPPLLAQLDPLAPQRPRR